jgi:hypothetical protein
VQRLILLLACLPFLLATYTGGPPGPGSGGGVNDFGDIADLGCDDAEPFIKWTDGTGLWDCGPGSSGGSIDFKEEDATKVTGGTFGNWGPGFDVEVDGAGASIDLDFTELDATVWGDNGGATVTQTFNPTGTATVFTFADASFAISGATTFTIGGLDVATTNDIAAEDHHTKYTGGEAVDAVQAECADTETMLGAATTACVVPLVAQDITNHAGVQDAHFVHFAKYTGGEAVDAVQAECGDAEVMTGAATTACVTPVESGDLHAEIHALPTSGPHTGTLPFSDMPQLGAYEMAINNTAGDGDIAGVKVTELSLEALPEALDFLLIERADGTLAYADIGNLPSGGGGEINTTSSDGGGLSVRKAKDVYDLPFASFASADFDLSIDLFTIRDDKWATDQNVTDAIGAEDHHTIYQDSAAVDAVQAECGDAEVMTGAATTACVTPVESGDLHAEIHALPTSGPHTGTLPFADIAQLGAWELALNNTAGAGDIAGVKISELTDRAAFGTGDKLMIEESTGELRKVDFDDLPGGGTVDELSDVGDVTLTSIADFHFLIRDQTTDTDWENILLSGDVDTVTLAGVLSLVASHTGSVTQVCGDTEALLGNAGQTCVVPLVTEVNNLGTVTWVNVPGANVVDTFCTGTSEYLDGTGTCDTLTIPTGANPTATIGAAAVNGSASTFMRSDGAPALAAKFLTHSCNISVETAETTDDIMCGQAHAALTLTGLHCVGTGSPSGHTVEVFECTTTGATCTTSTALTATIVAGEAVDTSCGGSCGITSGNWFRLDTTAVGTAADWVHCHVEYTID